MNVTVFLELHQGLLQQGPGSDASTARALAMVPHLPARPQILDLGCGPGRQTLVLAQQSGGTVVAVDLFPPFLEQLQTRAAAAGLADRVHPIHQSMDTLDFPAGSFDLIWSEGAIYNIGFLNGLRLWKRVLKPGGTLAVTELSWLTPDPPRDVATFWATAYPEMSSRQENLQKITEAGYTLVGDFTLPESDWWEGYYHQLEPRIDKLRAVYHRDPEACETLDEAQREIEVFHHRDGSYGYVFYIMQ
jgi:ubiquinone/menaquinone biosynthesis C-methylase UbiE